MRHGSLFSGIGGFDLAAEWMGWENVFHCEWNKFGRKILKHYWPDATSYSDITKTDFSIHRGSIDILTGGFPCQPFSSAGKRKGTDDNRYLWPEMLRAIMEVQPAWVVAENVYGIINQGRGMVFEQVQAQMEDEGYEVQSVILPACGVNAPHKRYRAWFVAYAGSINSALPIQQWGQEQTENINSFRQNESGFITNPNMGRFKERWPQWFTSKQFTQGYGLASEPGICRGDDGFSYRVDRLKALGNAIVPQVAYEIFKAIEAMKYP